MIPRHRLLGTRLRLQGCDSPGCPQTLRRTARKLLRHAKGPCRGAKARVPSLEAHRLHRFLSLTWSVLQRERPQPSGTLLRCETDWGKPGCGEASTEDPRTQLLPLITLLGLPASSGVWSCKVRNESPRATTVCPGRWSCHAPWTLCSAGWLCPLPKGPLRTRTRPVSGIRWP